MPGTLERPAQSQPMGILRRIETGLERVFEGGIGRTFKSHVQPVELARKLRKEMDDHRTISVSQVYVPNIYTLYLAPTDREQFATYEASLRTELAGYLAEHARREAYTLPGRARVLIETAEELAVGTFGIAVATEEEPRLPPADAPRREPSAPVEPSALPEEFLVGGDDAEPHPLPPVPVVAIAPGVAAAPAPDVDVVETGSETAALSARDAERSGLVRQEWALTWPGGRHVISRRAIVLGRSRDCDVTVDDKNVSRRHAELVRQGDAFVLRDLDSTNGSAVNGRRVKQAAVSAGDTITVGATSLTLEHVRT